MIASTKRGVSVLLVSFGITILMVILTLIIPRFESLRALKVFLSLFSIVGFVLFLAAIPVSIHFFRQQVDNERDRFGADLTDEQLHYITNWSWISLLSPPVWALGNRLYLLAILSLVPVVQIYPFFKLFLDGRKLAWLKRKSNNFDHFKGRQRIISTAVIVIFTLALAGTAAALANPTNPVPFTQERTQVFYPEKETTLDNNDPTVDSNRNGLSTQQEITPGTLTDNPDTGANNEVKTGDATRTKTVDLPYSLTDLPRLGMSLHTPQNGALPSIFDYVNGEQKLVKNPADPLESDEVWLGVRVYFREKRDCYKGEPWLSGVHTKLYATQINDPSTGKYAEIGGLFIPEWKYENMGCLHRNFRVKLDTKNSYRFYICVDNTIDNDRFCQYGPTVYAGSR